MWTDKAKREAIALAVVLATTLGGWHVQQASASTPKHVARVEERVPTPTDPADAVFAYGDLLDAVQYQLGFDRDARDAAALKQACTSLLDADEPEGALREAASPIVRYCHTRDEADAQQAPEAFVNYRETAFDVAK